MYHNYAIFNQNKLFLRFNGLLQEYKKKNKINNELSMYYDEFLFRIDCMYSQLNAINQIDQLITQQFEALKTTAQNSREANPLCPKLICPSHALLSYNTSFVNQLIDRIPPYLNSMNVIQDRILRIVGLYLEIEESKIPENYSAFFDKKNILNQYGDHIEKENLRYWRDHGRNIRHYRNLDQHNFNILSNYGINNGGDFILYLPDNPDEKKIENITYNKKLSCIQFLNETFDAFHEFVENMMKSLNIPEELHKIGVYFPNIYTAKDFSDRECIGIIQNDKNHVTLMYCSKKNEDGISCSLSMNELPLKINKMHLELI